MIQFITGSQNKFEEVKLILPNIERADIDLPEIQEIDAHKIIKSKLTEAFNHREGEFIVEDTSLYFECLNELPGPLIKWFLKTMGNDGLVNLVEKMGNRKATAKTIIGYAKNPNEVHFFEGIMTGEIVKPRGESTFGWDAIFLTDSHSKTYAEMSQDEKKEISMRAAAVRKLKEFLDTQDSK